jgi:hypothetical protein
MFAPAACSCCSLSDRGRSSHRSKLGTRYSKFGTHRIKLRARCIKLRTRCTKLRTRCTIIGDDHGDGGRLHIRLSVAVGI